MIVRWSDTPLITGFTVALIFSSAFGDDLTQNAGENRLALLMGGRKPHPFYYDMALAARAV